MEFAMYVGGTQKNRDCIILNRLNLAMLIRKHQASNNNTSAVTIPPPVRGFILEANHFVRLHTFHDPSKQLPHTLPCFRRALEIFRTDRFGHLLSLLNSYRYLRTPC